MNFGDQVIYVEKGVEYSATAMLVSNVDAHAGKNGEPSIGLAFFKKPFVPEYRYDVRHESFDNKGAYWKDVAPVAVAVPKVVSTEQAPAPEPAKPATAEPTAEPAAEPAKVEKGDGFLHKLGDAIGETFENRG